MEKGKEKVEKGKEKVGPKKVILCSAEKKAGNQTGDRSPGARPPEFLSKKAAPLRGIFAASTSTCPRPSSLSLRKPPIPDTSKHSDKRRLPRSPSLSPPKTYKEALLTLSSLPRHPCPPLIYTPFPLSPGSPSFKGRCFRCLGRSHRAAHCRGPIRCSRCFRTGHKARSCMHRLPMSVYRAMRARPSYLSAFVPLTDDFLTRQNRCRNAILADVLPAKRLGHFPQDTIANGLAGRFGGFPADFHVARHSERDFVIFLPDWVPSDELLRKEVVSLDDLRLCCFRWDRHFGARRPLLTYHAWIRLVSLPYECWSSRTVAALVGGFGRFIRPDDFSVRMVDLTGYRCLISVNHLHDIPENLEVTFGDLSLSVLIQLERWARRDDEGHGAPPMRGLASTTHCRAPRSPIATQLALSVGDARRREAPRTRMRLGTPPKSGTGDARQRRRFPGYRRWCPTHAICGPQPSCLLSQPHLISGPLCLPKSFAADWPISDGLEGLDLVGLDGLDLGSLLAPPFPHSGPPLAVPLWSGGLLGLTLAQIYLFLGPPLGPTSIRSPSCQVDYLGFLLLEGPSLGPIPFAILVLSAPGQVDREAPHSASKLSSPTALPSLGTTAASEISTLHPPGPSANLGLASLGQAACVASLGQAACVASLSAPKISSSISLPSLGPSGNLAPAAPGPAVCEALLCASEAPTPTNLPSLVVDPAPFPPSEPRGPPRSSARLLHFSKGSALERAKRRKALLLEGGTRALPRNWNTKTLLSKSSLCGVTLSNAEADDLQSFLLRG
uniref:CCHC-type domain-containing protein n=1 Tax=Ananas comosus var. bracteatus TaxID=296719 RepID=A0A6V7NF28_ANACO|nr:unnamed protein product [Ananas comosus var. bracteatus]